MENLFTIKTDSITAINETFRFFYPNEEPPKPTSLSFHLSTVMMHLAVVESKKFAVAVGVMKAIPNLNPENAATWLAKLPFKVISELWNSNDKIYTAVKNAINNKFKIAFFDLKMDENLDDVKRLLSEYNDLLGLDYKTEWFGITAIKVFMNKTDENVHIIKKENPSNDNIIVNANDVVNQEIWIPWVGNQGEFSKKVIEITFLKSKKKMYIWQIGNSVFSSDSGYENPGIPINGYFKPEGDRKLIIDNQSITLSVL